MRMFFAQANRRALRSVFFACLVAMMAPTAFAVTPGEMLEDAAMEARARDISQLLRCVVCQNQSIDDSNAPLAQDLRILVRDRLKAGDSNAAAINYIVERYGNFVLLKPPMQTNTLLLWFGPVIFLLLAGVASVRFFGRATKESAAELTPELTASERSRIEALMNEGNA